MATTRMYRRALRAGKPYRLHRSRCAFGSDRAMKVAAHRRLGLAMTAMALLAAMPASAIYGPRVVMAPPAGKPPDLFATEAEFCRSEANSMTTTEPQGLTIVSSAMTAQRPVPSPV